MNENGSPAPLFDTDGEDRRYFLIEIPVHPAFLRISRDQVEIKLNELKLVDFQLFASFVNKLEDGVWDQVRDQVGTMLRTMLLPNSLKAITALEVEKKREEILLAIGLTNKSTNFKRYVQPLMEAGWVEMTIPDKPNSALQKYRLTRQGHKIKSIFHG